MKFKKMKQESLRRLPKLLNPQFVIGDVRKFKEPRIIQDWVLWLEQLSSEGGRTSVFVRPWGQPDSIAQELTPFPINVKSRIHGYGGAPISIACFGNELILLWINDLDGCLWKQMWSGLQIHSEDLNPKLNKQGSLFCLSIKDNSLLADGLIDLERNRWLGVMEKENKDYLVSFLLNQEFQEPEILYKAKDFLGYISMNQTANKLAWVEWQKPFMPWDSSYLKIGLFDSLGDISETSIMHIDLRERNDMRTYSVFQPNWLNSNELLVVSDINGWWNLFKVNVDFSYEKKTFCFKIFNVEADLALPQWISGMSTISINQGKVICLSCANGIWKISIVSENGFSKDISLPFDNFSDLNANNGRVVAIASNSYSEPGLLEIDLKNDSYNYQSSRDFSFDPRDISVGEPFWFNGFNGERTHAWYYPPKFSINQSSPLLVRAHSGPTAMAGKELDLELQFWTSRGWSILDVNYGGSTGFGRSYRDRLKGKWGEVDVFDCSEAANELVKVGRADKNLIAILGSSAGGFTALNCLQSSNIFSVAACKYPVIDLLDMSKNTHRFEEGYLDYLVGSLPSKKQLYFQRSPVNNVSKINCPVIFFQGLKDKVVNPEQTQKIFQLLKKNKVPVEMHTFANEGHGFGNEITKIKVLTETERFFKDNLRIIS